MRGRCSTPVDVWLDTPAIAVVEDPLDGHAAFVAGRLRGPASAAPVDGLQVGAETGLPKFVAERIAFGLQDGEAIRTDDQIARGIAVSSFDFQVVAVAHDLSHGDGRCTVLAFLVVFGGHDPRSVVLEAHRRVAA